MPLKNTFSSWADKQRKGPLWSSMSKGQRKVVAKIGPPERCFYCCVALRFTMGREPPLPPNTATVDHVLPRARGGDWSTENMVWSCHECNDMRNRVQILTDAGRALDAEALWINYSADRVLHPSFTKHIL